MICPPIFFPQLSRSSYSAYLRCGLLLTLAVALTLAVSGCSRPARPPEPLPAEKIAPELQKAFAQAPTEAKDLVGEIERTLQSKDYPAAYQRVQLLQNMPNCTDQQRLVAVRASLTLTALLQAAQAQGDGNAAAVLDHHKRTR